MTGVERAKRLEDEVAELAKTLDTDIDCGLALIEEVHAYLAEIDLDDSDHCIAVFGTAGVGKSTVVSLLFGDGKARVHHENPYSRVLVAEKPLRGVDIRSGCVSKTLLPGVVHTKVNGERVVVFDMPGSQDTRGPFAKLIVHSILKGVMAKHKTMHSVLVATPPQDRPQAIALAQAINKAGGSNAVLVYTKCDHDFNPKCTEMLEGVEPDKREISAYALRRPAASVEENHDYSAEYESTKCKILEKLLRPVMEAREGFGSAPASAELLLQMFSKRVTESAREALTSSFLEMVGDRFYRSFGVISEVVAALDSPQQVDFMNMMETLQLLLPPSFEISFQAIRDGGFQTRVLDLDEGARICTCAVEFLSLLPLQCNPSSLFNSQYG